MKLHHSLTDGLGGMQLALLLFDTTREPVRSETMPEAPLGEHLDTPALIRESVAASMTRASGMAGDVAWGVLPSAIRAASQPLRTLESALATARSIGRTVAPVRVTLSPIMTERGLGRHLDMVEVGLADLKRAAAAAGGSVNDGFMAAATGGLRRYHERHGATVDSLRVTLPISIRTAADPMGGNRITLIRFPVLVSEADPAARIPAMGRMCRAARDERSLEFTNAIAGALNLLPHGVVGSMLKHVDFLASDVPGFPFPVYLGGARMERYSPFGPTIGASVNMTLLSYDGTCCVGVTVDTAAVPDHDVFLQCLREGFDEVLALGGAYAPARLPIHDRPAKAAA
jgi:WS/DGAT/MGAT family acyltransferase